MLYSNKKAGSIHVRWRPILSSSVTINAVACKIELIVDKSLFCGIMLKYQKNI